MSEQGQLRDRLRDLAPRLSADPEPVRKKLAELLVADPPGFRVAALEMLPAVARLVPRLVQKYRVPVVRMAAEPGTGVPDGVAEST